MKLNKRIIIPAMSLLVGAALAGSVSSTIAWYQYSTRANVAYLGTSAGTSGNLKIRIRGQNDWGTRLEIDDVNAYILIVKAMPYRRPMACLYAPSSSLGLPWPRTAI